MNQVEINKRLTALIKNLRDTFFLSLLDEEGGVFLKSSEDEFLSLEQLLNNSVKDKDQIKAKLKRVEELYGYVVLYHARMREILPEAQFLNLKKELLNLVVEL